jgi:hypothetical protein
MRILLILLSLVLQWNVSGNSVNIPQGNCVQKTLNAEKGGIKQAFQALFVSVDKTLYGKIIENYKFKRNKR